VLTFDDSTKDQLATTRSARVKPDTAVGIMLAFAREHPEVKLAGTFFVNREPFAGAREGPAMLRFLVTSGSSSKATCAGSILAGGHRFHPPGTRRVTESDFRPQSGSLNRVHDSVSWRTHMAYRPKVSARKRNDARSASSRPVRQPDVSPSQSPCRSTEANPSTEEAPAQTSRVLRAQLNEFG
jgi:hypothetical protein